MSTKIKENIIRRDNTNNVTYLLRIFVDNTYEYTTLTLRSGCYIVTSKTTGIWTK